MAITERWLNHIETWKSSGLTQVEYCRRHDLNPNTFSSRLHLYRKQIDSPAGLIPVKIKSAIPATTPIVLHHLKGHRLELPTTLSAQWLAELLQCLA